MAAELLYCREGIEQAHDPVAEGTVHEGLLGTHRLSEPCGAAWESFPQSSPAYGRLSRIPALCTSLFAVAAVVAFATVVLFPEDRRGLQSHLQAPMILQEQPFTGTCAIVEQDTDFLPGGPGAVDYAMDHIDSAEFCCSMCHGIETCQAWVWKDGNLEGVSYQCWIMQTAATQRVSVKGVVSGMPPMRPKVPPSVASAGPVAQAAVDPRAGCAEYGQNCWEFQRCCKNPNQRCFMKNSAWAGCRETCTAGIQSDDPVEAQQAWTCSDVTEEVTSSGGGNAAALSTGPPPPLAPMVRRHYDPPPPAAPFVPEAPLAKEATQPYYYANAPMEQGTKLFCFALIQSTGYEAELMADQKEMETSIFGCEAYAIYSNRAFEVAPGIHTSVVPDSLKCDFHEIAWNTNIFISVWHMVVTQGWYQSQDWVVKADADATFFPGRLRALLPQHQGAGYLVNCQYGLHGPIEVVSSAAVNTLAADYAGSAGGLRPEKCVQKYAQAIVGDAQWGEDMFLDYCLRELGVTAQPEYRLMCESHCDCPNWFWCSNGTDRVSYHPFKRKDMYRQCVANALYTR